MQIIIYLNNCKSVLFVTFFCKKSVRLPCFKGSKDRPELSRFLDKVEAKPKFHKCLYVTELSCLGRQLIDARITVTNLLEIGIDVCVTSINGGSHLINPDGSTDKTKFAVLGLLIDFAQIEIDVFKSWASSSLKQKISDGGATGGLMQPYGYLKDKHKKLVIDNEESKTIQFILEQNKQGFEMGSLLLIE